MQFTEPPKVATVSLNGKSAELQTKKTYFYEVNGNIVPAEAREAWELHKKKHKQIGVSDGSKYAQAIMESRELFKTEGIEKSQERLRQGYEEELESAKGNFETPPNNDVFGNGVREFNQRRV